MERKEGKGRKIVGRKGNDGKKPKICFWLWPCFGWSPLPSTKNRLFKRKLRSVVKLLTGEGLVERFMSILWSGTMSCSPSSAAVSTSSESVRPVRYFLDRARVSCGGQYDDIEVDIVRDIVMTVPVFFTLIIFSAFTSQVRMLAFSVNSAWYFLKFHGRPWHITVYSAFESQLNEINSTSGPVSTGMGDRIRVQFPV